MTPLRYASNRGGDPISNARSPDPGHAKLLAALHFAADKHRDQRRKGAESSPYINHPIAVAEVLARVGSVTDLAVLQAAALHDTLEDTETTREELVERFGAEVAGIVEEVTDDKELEKAERKRRQVEHAPHLSHAAKLVKLGDKICNVRDVLCAPPKKWSAERRAEYVEWSLAVVDRCRGTNAALERHFDELVSEARAANESRSTKAPAAEPPAWDADAWLNRFRAADEEFRGAFRRIVFAIFDDHNAHGLHSPEGNYKPFARVFGTGPSPVRNGTPPRER